MLQDQLTEMSDFYKCDLKPLLCVCNLNPRVKLHDFFFFLFLTDLKYSQTDNFIQILSSKDMS